MTALQTRVHVAGGDKPFGELTLAEVEGRAEELRAAVGFGPTARIASTARAWTELARRMRAADAATVAQVDAAQLAALVEPLWIVAPWGGQDRA